MYLYASREFVELLLAQPVRRSELFVGLLVGLVAPVTMAVIAGISLPLALGRVAPATLWSNRGIATNTTARNLRLQAGRILFWHKQLLGSNSDGASGYIWCSSLRRSCERRSDRRGCRCFRETVTFARL